MEIIIVDIICRMIFLLFSKTSETPINNAAELLAQKLPLIIKFILTYLFNLFL